MAGTTVAALLFEATRRRGCVGTASHRPPGSQTKAGVLYMRNIEFWKTRLAAVEKEVQRLSTELDKTKDVHITGPNRAPQSNVLPMRTKWLSWIWAVGRRRKIKARREMLLKKIPYYKERIEARTKRTAFDAVRRPRNCVGFRFSRYGPVARWKSESAPYVIKTAPYVIKKCDVRCANCHRRKDSVGTWFLQRVGGA